MPINNITLSRSRDSILATNTVLRNTYLLLGATLLFSGFTAWIAMVTNAPILSPWITLLIYFGLLFLTSSLRNSPFGLLATFAFTGFMGYSLGPILNYYLSHIINGHQIVMASLGGTGLIFVSLSAYALVSRKDFSYMGASLVVGLLVAFLLSLAGMIFHWPAVMLAMSAMFILLSSGVILFQTSMIIHGGETNYIMATINIYVALYNIFISLLTLLTGNSRD